MREGRRQRPDASYHDAQGATPRASLEGEREKVEGAGENVAAGVAKTLIRSSSHVAPFLYQRFFLLSRGRFERPLTDAKVDSGDASEGGFNYR